MACELVFRACMLGWVTRRPLLRGHVTAEPSLLPSGSRTCLRAGASACAFRACVLRVFVAGLLLKGSLAVRVRWGSRWDLALHTVGKPRGELHGVTAGRKRIACFWHRPVLIVQRPASRGKKPLTLGAGGVPTSPRSLSKAPCFEPPP